MQYLQKTTILIWCVLFASFVFADAQANPDDGINPPALSVDIDAIEDQLLVRDIENYPITVSNDGDEELSFTVTTETISVPDLDNQRRGVRSIADNEMVGPIRDDAGDVLATIRANEYRSHGISWDEDHNWMWFDNYTSPSSIYAYDPEAGEVAANFGLPENTGGLLYLNGILYTRYWGQRTNTIFRYDIEGNGLEPLVFDFPIFTGFMTTDGENILTAGGWADVNGWRVRILDPETLQEVGQIDAHGAVGDARIMGLEWVEEHPRGKLWLVGGDGHVYQCRVNGDQNCELTQDFETGLGATDVIIAHDGENMWLARSSKWEWHILDDGNEEHFLITCDPATGRIAAGEESVVTVTFDSRWMVEGDYSCEVTFTSDDPDEAPVVVNVEVFVEGWAEITAKWPEECGYPDGINWNSMYEDLFVDNSYQMAVELTNTGSALLEIDGIVSNHDYFTTNIEDGIELEIRESTELMITFEAPGDEPGDFESSISIFSNYLGNEEFDIPIHAQAMNPPQIELDINAIEDELLIGSSEEYPVTVSNNGEAPLRFTVSHEYLDEPEEDDNERSIRSVEDENSAGPSRDEAGEVLRQYQMEINRTMGLAFDGDNGLMWGYNREEPPLFTAVDLESGEVIRQFDAPEYCYGLEYRENALICSGSDNNPTSLLRFDTEGNRLEPIELPIEIPSAFFTFSDQYLLINRFGNFEIEVIRLEDMEQVARMNFGQAVQGADIYCIEWISAHTEGPLWLASGGHYFQCSVDDEWNVNLVQDFAVQEMGPPVGGIAHDGENLWRAVYHSNIWQVIDDGFVETNWITYEPAEGEVQGDDQMEVAVTIDVTGLLAGDYLADLSFSSNDPDAPEAVISVEIFVVGGADINANWSEEYGYPEVLDWNSVHDELYAGFPYEMVVELSNFGTELLIIEGIISESEYFSTNFDDGAEIEVDEFVDLVITFQAPADNPDDYESMITIISNDPDNEELEIAVQASALSAPEIELNVNAIEDELFAGDISDYPIVVSNNGGSPLVYSVSTETIEEELRDNNKRSIRSLSENDQIGPRRDDAGDVITIHNPPRDRTHGLSWDGDHNWMWISNYQISPDVYAYDPENDEMVVGIETEFNTGGMLYLDGVVYTRAWGQRTNTFYRWDAEGNALEDLVFDFGIFTGFMTTDGEHIITAGGWADVNNWRIRVLDPENRLEVAQIDARHITGQAEIMGLEWVNEHSDGQLWLISNEGHVYQCSVDEDWNCELVQEFDTGLAAGDVTIAHDGENMWVGRIRRVELVVVDDGIDEFPWVYSNPRSGEIAAGEQTEVTVTIDCNRLIEGDYLADVTFTSNDPATPEAVISVEIHVNGLPRIEVTWPEECGYPDVVDWNCLHDELLVENAYDMVVDLSNFGSDLLIVEGVFSNHDYFNTNLEDGVEIEPDGSAELIITFAAPLEDGGDHDAIVSIISNDPDNEEFEIALHARAMTPPRISINLQAIEDELLMGVTEEYPITVSNDGGAPLTFRVSHEYVDEPEVDNNQRSVRSVNNSDLIGPRRDDAGDVLREYQVNQRRNMGLAWDEDNGIMWGLNHYDPPLFLALDPESGEFITQFEAPHSTCGLVYLNGVLICSGSDRNPETIFRFDTDGNQLESIESPVNLVHTFVASDGEHLFLNCFDNPEINVFTIEDMEFVATMNFGDATQGTPIWGFEWISTHSNAPLWLAGNNRYFQCSVDGDWNVNLVQDFEVPQGARPNSGIAHDGDNLWRAIYNGPSIWYVIDDGIEEQCWISYDPRVGEIESDEQLDVTVTIDCESLLAGDYLADIYFESNDPVDPELVVSVEIFVVGAPDISVEWPDDFGYPDGVNWNAAYEELYTGANYEMTVLISNLGTDLLSVEDIISGNEYFTVDFEDVIELEVGEATEITIDFEAPVDDPGEVVSSITIFSNDPDEAEVEILLVANAQLPPEIVVEGNEIEDVLESGEISEHLISISNEGGSPLAYSITHETTAEPEVDNNQRNVRSVNDYSNAGPRRDDAGDVVTVHNIPRDRTHGLSWDDDNNWMWVSSYRFPQSVYAFDPENGEMPIEMETNYRTGGLLYLDGIVYTRNWGREENTFYRWDVEGNVLEPLVFGFNIFTGFITTDGEHILTAGGWADVNNWRVRVLDPVNRQEVAQIDARGITGQESIMGLEWVNEHPFGQLWLISDEGHVFQCSVDEDWNCELVQEFQTGLRAGDVTIAHDGENMWVGRMSNATLVVLDDGNIEMTWLTYENDRGVLNPDEDTDVIFTLNATDLIEGDYEAEIQILSNDPENGEVVIPVIMHVGIELKNLTLRLNRGWNMNSINIVPPEEFWNREEGPDVVLMTEQLRVDDDTHLVELLKNEAGQFFAPRFNNFCNIPYWNLEQGISIKIDPNIEQEFVEAEWTGVPIPADAPINIGPGWHIIAYYPEYELDASRPDFYVLSPIIESVGLAKNNNGQFMSPEFNFSNMEPWCETQGYQIRIDQDEPVVLHYPAEQQEVAFNAEKDEELNITEPILTRSNMSVLVTSTSSASGRIEAVSSKGTVVGCGVIEDGRCGLVVWGDDVSTGAVEGLADGETFNLRLIETDGNGSFDLNPEIVHTGSGLVYRTNVFTALDVAVRSEIPVNYYLAGSYPNPFNSVTRIAFGMPVESRVTLSIFDVQGRLVTELINLEYSAGTHTINWNAADISTGIYLVRLEAANFTATQKIMLVK